MMDDEDSGPGHFLTFLLALLVLLVQLDVLGNTVNSSGNACQLLSYSIGEEKGQEVEIPEEFYYNFRLGVPVLPSFQLSFSGLAPVEILPGFIPGILKYIPQNNRPMRRMCCVYLL